MAWKYQWIDQQVFESSSKENLVAVADEIIRKLLHGQSETTVKHEQELHRLEQIHAAACAERDQKSKLLDEERKRGHEIMLELENKKQNGYKLESALQTKSHDTEVLREEAEKLKRDKQTMINIITEKDTQLQDVTALKQSVSEELASCKNELKDLREKYNQLDIERAELSSELNRHKRLMEVLEKDHKWSSEELTKKSEQFSEFRRTKEQQVLDLQMKHENLLQELTDNEKARVSLQRHLSESTDKIQELTLAINREKEQAQANETRIIDELNAKEKLNTMLKNEIEEQIKYRTKLQNQLDAKNSTLRKEQEERKRRQEEYLTEKLKMEEEIQRCKTELAQYKEFQQSGPSVDFSVRLAKIGEVVQAKLKELADLPPSHQYNMAIQSQQKCEELELELSHEKAETMRLTLSLQEIQRRSEETGKKMYLLEKEYQLAVNRYSKELARIQEAHNTIKIKNAQVKVLEERVVHYQKQEEIMSEQIQQMLFNSQGGSFSNSSSSTAAPSNWLAFKDVQELQQKNLELMKQVQVLTSNQSMENAQQKEEMLHKFIEEVEHLKATRSRDEEILSHLVKENNMYKQLIESFDVERQQFSRHNALMSQQASPAAKAAPDQGRVQSDAVRQEFEIYKNESKRNLEMFQNRVVTLEKECNELRAHKITLEGDIELLKTRFEATKKHVEPLNNEIATLRSVNQKLTGNIIQYQEQLSYAHDISQKHIQEAQRSQVICDTLKAQMSVFEEQEKRNKEEIADLRNERRNQQKLFDQLKAHQESRETEHVEIRQKLNAEIDDLKKKVVASKEKLEAQKSNYQAAVESLEISLKTISLELEDSRKQVHQQSILLAESKERLQSLEDKNTSLNSQLTESEKKVNFFLQTASPKLVSLLEEASASSSTATSSAVEAGLDLQLKEALNEKKSLQNNLQIIQKNRDHYKELASKISEDLALLTRKSQDSLSSSNALIQEKEKLIEELRQRELSDLQLITELREQLSTMEADLKTSRASSEEIQGDLKREIASLKEQLTLSESTKSVLQKEAQTFDSKFDEITNKYKDQLRETVNTINRLDEISKINEGLKEELRGKTVEVSTLTEKLQNSEETLKTTKVSLESQLAQAQTRLKEAHEVLENQMSKLLSQPTLPTITSSTSSAPSTSISTEDLLAEYTLKEKTIEELQEVVRYLRNERKIIEQRLEVSDKETVRWKQQADVCLRARDEAHALLRKEQERSREQVISEVEYKAQQEQLRQLNVVKESNANLRELCQKKTSDLERARAKIEELKKQLDPTEEKIRELTSKIDSGQKELQDKESQIQIWKTRAQQYIERYKSIDPEVHEKIKIALEKANQELTTLKSEETKSTEYKRKTNEQLLKYKEKEKKLAEELEKKNQQIQAFEQQIKQIQQQKEQRRQRLQPQSPPNATQAPSTSSQQAQSTSSQQAPQNLQSSPAPLQNSAQQTQPTEITSESVGTGGMKRKLESDQDELPPLKRPHIVQAPKEKEQEQEQQPQSQQMDIEPHSQTLNAEEGLTKMELENSETCQRILGVADIYLQKITKQSEQQKAEAPETQPAQTPQATQPESEPPSIPKTTPPQQTQLPPPTPQVQTLEAQETQPAQTPQATQSVSEPVQAPQAQGPQAQAPQAQAPQAQAPQAQTQTQTPEIPQTTPPQLQQAQSPAPQVQTSKAQDVQPTTQPGQTTPTKSQATTETPQVAPIQSPQATQAQTSPTHTPPKGTPSPQAPTAQTQLRQSPVQPKPIPSTRPARQPPIRLQRPPTTVPKQPPSNVPKPTTAATTPSPTTTSTLTTVTTATTPSTTSTTTTTTTKTTTTAATTTTTTPSVTTITAAVATPTPATSTAATTLSSSTGTKTVAPTSSARAESTLEVQLRNKLKAFLSSTPQQNRPTQQPTNQPQQSVQPAQSQLQQPTQQPLPQQGSTPPATQSQSQNSTNPQ